MRNVKYQFIVFIKMHFYSSLSLDRRLSFSPFLIHSWLEILSGGLMMCVQHIQKYSSLCQLSPEMDFTIRLPQALPHLHFFSPRLTPFSLGSLLKTWVLFIKLYHWWIGIYCCHFPHCCWVLLIVQSLCFFSHLVCITVSRKTCLHEEKVTHAFPSLALILILELSHWHPQHRTHKETGNIFFTLSTPLWRHIVTRRRLVDFLLLFTFLYFRVFHYPFSSDHFLSVFCIASVVICMFFIDLDA